MKVRTRFAPSPTGFMHLGGMRTALYAYLFAKKNGGDFILRIEDTDRERLVEGATEVIYSSLKQGGMVYDEGPDIGGNYGPYIQSDRKSIYTKYAEKLIELGGAYYCFCTKERLEGLRDENGNAKYDKHCLKLSKEEIQERLDRGDKYVIRQNIPLEGKSVYDDLIYGTITVDYDELEDNVLIKSDGLPTYNFANVVDDHLMQISHVIRGSEYLSSTPKYNLMYDAFGWERPIYIHLPPIMKDATRKLSKRYGDANFDDFVKKGYLPEAIINYIALLGWCPKDNSEKMTMAEMTDKFGLDGISKSPSIFDEIKLAWLNGEYLKAMSDEEFYDVAKPFIEQSGLDASKFNFEVIASLMKTRVEVLNEIPAKIEFLNSFDKIDSEMYFHKKMKTDVELAKTVIPLVYKKLAGLSTFDKDSLHQSFVEVAEENGLKSGQVMFIIRIALTAAAVTPGGAVEMAEVLGQEESISRLKLAEQQIN